MSPTGNRRRFLRPAIVAAAILAGVTGVVISAVIPRKTETIAVSVLSLLATRDMGALPTEATFCGAVGTLGAPEHAYKLDEAAGNLTDCSGNGLTLTAAGVPRYGVVPGVPVSGSPVSYTAEKGIASDGSGRFTGTDTPAAVATITFVYRAMRHTATYYLFDWAFTGTTGYAAYVSSAGVVSVRANLGTTITRTIAGGFVADTGAINCVTVAFNGASTVGWINGTPITWSTAWVDYGNTTGANAVALMSNSGGGSTLRGALFRYRLDHAAGTLADHRLLCGTFTYPLRSDHAAYADTTFSHSGGTKCFQTGALSATCMGPGAMGYAWDGTANQWIPVDSRVNRLLYSQAPSCTNYTCGGGATIAAAIAPDGSYTAGAITMGAGTVDVAGTGYTNNAAVYPRLWTKCTGGNLTIAHQGGTGSWTVDCTHASLNGQWALLHAAHAAVAVGAAWTATAAGAVTVRYSGRDASLWMPTVAEVDGYSVIPTLAAAVTTGDSLWSIANATGTYWKAGDAVTSDITLLGASPACWVTGSPLYLTGAPGSECTGIVRSVEAVR